MNYLWELWEIWERSPPDRRSDHRSPFPVHGLQPARPASLRPYPQQQPEAAGSSPAAGSSRKQPRSSSPAAAAPQHSRGASLGFAIYATKMSVFVAERNAGNGHHLPIGASRYMLTCPSAAFSRNFLFSFFYFGAWSPILDSWPFLRP